MPCAPARNAPGNHSLLDPVDSLSGDSARFSFSRLRRRYAARSPCPSLLASAVAAGFAARILGYGHRRRVIRVGESFAFQTSLFQLHPSAAQPPSVPSAFGCHPGTAAVIPAVIHARRAFGLQFFPGCQWMRSLRFQPHSSRWNVNSGSAATGYRSPSVTSFVAAASVENRTQGLTPAKPFPHARRAFGLLVNLPLPVEAFIALRARLPLEHRASSAWALKINRFGHVIRARRLRLKTEHKV